MALYRHQDQERTRRYRISTLFIAALIAAMLTLIGCATAATSGASPTDTPAATDPTTAPPISEPTQPSLDGPNVVEYDWSEYDTEHPIEGSYYVVNKGEKVDGGCRFVVQDLRGSEGGGTLVRQVAVNPDTCEELLEVSNSPYTLEEVLQRDRPGEGGIGSSDKPQQRESGLSPSE